jgi:hypothetical protein
MFLKKHYQVGLIIDNEDSVRSVTHNALFRGTMIPAATAARRSLPGNRMTLYLLCQ